MRTRSLLIGAIAALGTVGAVGLPAAAADDPETMIIGGHDATANYSFMASLQSQGRHLCGASLIESDRVVTAAHCVRGGGDFTVRVGSNDRTSGGEQARVTEVRAHPSADLAVLKLGRHLQSKPIEIASEAGAPGTATRIIGWGQTCPTRGCGTAPAMLQALDTRIVADSECGNITGRTEVCTDNPGGDSGACYGDSGGPQIKGTPGDWKLVGATSRSGNGSPVCATGPSIYTDVAALSGWIDRNTGA